MLMMQNMMILGNIMKLKMRQLFSDENGEVNIVAIVVIMGIAVLLALFFKEQVMSLLESLFGTITNKANSAVSGNASET